MRSKNTGGRIYVRKTLKCNCSCCDTDSCCLYVSVLGGGVNYFSALLMLKSFRVCGQQKSASVAHPSFDQKHPTRLAYDISLVSSTTPSLHIQPKHDSIFSDPK